MSKSKKTFAEIEKDLLSFTQERCPGIKVTVEHSERWDRTCFTFRWSGFEGLLLEERFRIIAHLVPPDYYSQHCSEAVWLELTLTETIKDYLSQPRSEDVDDQIQSTWKMLAEKNFFAALEDELVRMPLHQCPNDFTYSKRVLDAQMVKGSKRDVALLSFMRHQAYCDWEVLRKIRPMAEKGKTK